MARARAGGGPAALLLAFLLAHLAFLPSTLEDVDSVNFAMGVRHFDVAHHQPHPPGYPVFIALAKASTATLRGVGVSAPAVRGLSIWSALAGTAALPAVFVFVEAIDRRRTLAWWCGIAVGCAPLFWFTALRPLSDATGFAVAMWALALGIRAGENGGRLAAAGALAGFAIGIRSQMGILTLPLFVFALARQEGASVRARILAAAACVAAVLAWAVPLLVVSGGPAAYLQALGSQAGQDFSGVSMLWTRHSVREIASALVNTFVAPWGPLLGAIVCIAAAAGFVRVALRAPRTLLVLLIAFAPYALFHLLFQETVTTRYALPLLVPVVYLALAAVQSRWTLVTAAAGGALAAIGLFVSVGPSATYATEGSPVFRVFDDMAITAHGGERVDAIGYHASARRAAEWDAPIMPARIASGRHGEEWLALVALWRERPAAQVWFVADPKRTDLALLDPRARDLIRAYGWGFPEPPFVGGARPSDVDWYRLRPPGWMLDKGWSLTAETGGVAAQERAGPHLAPAIAWLKARSEDVLVEIGGRTLTPNATSTIALTLAGHPVDTFTAPTGYFYRRFTLAAGALANGPYVPLAVTASGPSNPAVSLEQFDAQGPGVPMFGYDTGWYEPEYNPELGRAWRWMSERAVLWVRPIGRNVTLRLEGESPVRSFTQPPHVRISIGGREIASFDPGADFTREIVLPADALAAADGRVDLASSTFFVPGAASGGDRRHLALRMFSVGVR